jgi:hypothetical protein
LDVYECTYVDAQAHQLASSGYRVEDLEFGVKGTQARQ